MSLASGSLNRRITIQKRDAGTDSAGGPLLTWTDVATVWANIIGATGMGAITASGDVPTALKQYSFRIRFREGLDEGMRVIYSGETFDIRAVRMDFAGRVWTDLVCETGNDG
jgi:SPP1 family predicted phage head-tail adaptor